MSVDELDREQIIQQARLLIEGSKKLHSSEYLRGVCELIAFCFREPLAHSMESDIAEVEMEISSPEHRSSGVSFLRQKSVDYLPARFQEESV